MLSLKPSAMARIASSSALRVLGKRRHVGVERGVIKRDARELAQDDRVDAGDPRRLAQELASRGALFPEIDVARRCRVRAM